MAENLESIFGLLKGKEEDCDQYLFEDLMELIEDEEVEV